MKFALLAIIFAILSAPQAARAELARANILKSQIEGFLEQQAAVARENGSTLETKGSITVEEAQGYYALTLPHITYTDAQGIRSEIGMVAVNAVPKNDREWNITIAIPTPINSYNPQGQLQFRADIGNQTVSGTWHEWLGHFTAMNALLENLRFQDVFDKDTLSIGRIAMTSTLTEKDAGAYTGSAELTAETITADDKESLLNATLPRIALTTTLADQAGTRALTKDDIKNRPTKGQVDAYNIFAFLFGAPERIVGQITGLDAVNLQLQQSLLTAPPQARQKLFAAVAGLSALGAMGQPVSGDPGTRTYEVVFGDNGQVMLNGSDIGALFSIANNKKASQ